MMVKVVVVRDKMQLFWNEERQKNNTILNSFLYHHGFKEKHNFSLS